MSDHRHVDLVRDTQVKAGDEDSSLWAAVMDMGVAEDIFEVNFVKF